MQIEGTVTISIQTFEELKAAAEEGENYRRKLQSVSEEVTSLIGFNDVEYLARLAEIDKIENISDKKLKKIISEALSLQKIVVDADKLKKFLKKYIDEEASENCCEIANATYNELKAIQLTIKQESDEEE